MMKEEGLGEQQVREGGRGAGCGVDAEEDDNLKEGQRQIVTRRAEGKIKMREWRRCSWVNRGNERR